MKPIYETMIQAQINAYQNAIRRVQKELTEEFDRKMNQRTGHLQEALTKLYRENIPIKYELNELDEIELQEMKDEQIHRP